ncbi:ribosomal large subunit pseudouridine synthase A [Rhodobacteraceae bacterium HIMB11]|nr:ribosomal large subunit pseudouridine synthase A [Rhodobacteraceae bacterium HIMB11]
MKAKAKRRFIIQETVFMPPFQSEYNPPNDPIEVVYEDAHVVAVNKPTGLLSVPGKGEHLSDCMLSRVMVAFPDALLVHRLDRDTSGVMVFALTVHAQRSMSMQFEARSTKKTYVACVAGEFKESEGEIDLPLIVDWPNRPKQMVCHETGKPAVTEFKRMSVTDGRSRLRLFPKTGRSHQLRVHCLAIGHPILGDPLYAPETVADFPRLLLHSEELRINHPESGKGLRFRAKCPF